jgi:hypothetical protein
MAPVFNIDESDSLYALIVAESKEYFQKVSVAGYLLTMPRHPLSASDCACLAIECLVRVKEGKLSQSVVYDILGDMLVTKSESMKIYENYLDMINRASVPGHRLEQSNLVSMKRAPLQHGQTSQVSSETPAALFPETLHGGMTTASTNSMESDRLDVILSPCHHSRAAAQTA